MTSTFRLTASLAVALSLLACDEASGPSAAAWSGTVSTLPSGRLVVHNPDVPVWSERERWVLEEQLRIGAFEGDGPDLFGEVLDVELGPAGEVYVLDAQAEEVRVFAADGTHVRTLGRPGQGPGELNRPAGMALGPSGALWIMNWRNARYTAFDPGTGALIREPRRLASYGPFPWPGSFDRSGRLLDVGLADGGDIAILVLDTAFVPRDTLAMPRVDDRHVILFRREGMLVMSMMQPFAPQPAWAPHPAGGIVVGEGEAYRLHRIEPSGDTIMTVQVAREPVRVTRAERDSAMAAFAARIEEYGGGLTPDDEVQVSDTKPAHGPLFVDDRDHVWVHATTVAGSRPMWDVIDPEGRLLGQVAEPESPSFVRPAARAGRLALVTTATGYPEVVVYRLVRAGSS